MTSNALDRRLTTRVQSLWKRAAGNRFPRRSQIDPRDFGADWSNCLMIDLDPACSRSRLSFVGAALRDPTWPTFERQCISECLEGTLLELVTRHIPRLLSKKKPISFGGTATHDEVDILYRTILLPLSENGEEIDGVLGAVAYREVSASEETGAADERDKIDSQAVTGNGHAERAHRPTRSEAH